MTEVINPTWERIIHVEQVVEDLEKKMDLLLRKTKGIERMDRLGHKTDTILATLDQIEKAVDPPPFSSLTL